MAGLAVPIAAVVVARVAAGLGVGGQWQLPLGTVPCARMQCQLQPDYFKDSTAMGQC